SAARRTAPLCPYTTLFRSPPLPLTDAAAGDSAVVHGYPYGGPPSTVPAGVAATGSFRVPDIYAQSPTDRSVATLQSEIEAGNSRSEEHTSELQSRFDLVCR